MNGISNFLKIASNQISSTMPRASHYSIFITSEKKNASREQRYIQTLYSDVLKESHPNHAALWMTTSPGIFQTLDTLKIYSSEELSQHLKQAKGSLIQVRFFVLDNDLKRFQAPLLKMAQCARECGLNIHVHIITKLSSQLPDRQALNNLKLPEIELSLISPLNESHAKLVRDTYHLPTHLVPLRLDESDFTFRDFSEKEDLIILSPDSHPHQKDILKTLKKHLPRIKQVVLDNEISKESYLNYLSKAKWALSCHPVRDSLTEDALNSGCVIFRPQCPLFEEESHYELETLYSSLSQLENKLIYDINRFNHPLRFALLQQITQRHLQQAPPKTTAETMPRLLSLNFNFPFPFQYEVSVQNLPTPKLDEWASFYGRVS